MYQVYNTWGATVLHPAQMSIARSPAVTDRQKEIRYPGCLLIAHLVATRYGTALNEAEKPVITWVQVLGSYLYYLGRVS